MPTPPNFSAPSRPQHAIARSGAVSALHASSTPVRSDGVRKSRIAPLTTSAPRTMRMRRPTPEEAFGGVHVGAAFADRADGEAGTSSDVGGGNAPVAAD